MREYTIHEIDSILDSIEDNIPKTEAFSDYEMEIMDQFSRHDAEDIRARIAVLLVNFTEERGERLLLSLTKDKDSLVRTEACDSLSQSKSPITYSRLMEIASKDKNGLVRGYAISSLAEIASKLHKEIELVTFLAQRLIKEKVVFTKINIYKALYDMGEYDYLDNLICNLNARIYKNRCAVIHLLEEVVDEDNHVAVVAALKERRGIEKTNAVNSAIDELLEKIN